MSFPCKLCPLYPLSVLKHRTVSATAAPHWAIWQCTFCRMSQRGHCEFVSPHSSKVAKAFHMTQWKRAHSPESLHLWQKQTNQCMAPPALLSELPDEGSHSSSASTEWDTGVTGGPPASVICHRGQTRARLERLRHVPGEGSTPSPPASQRTPRSQRQMGAGSEF